VEHAARLFPNVGNALQRFRADTHNQSALDTHRGGPGNRAPHKHYARHAPNHSSSSFHHTIGLLSNLNNRLLNAKFSHASRFWRKRIQSPANGISANAEAGGRSMPPPGFGAGLNGRQTEIPLSNSGEQSGVELPTAPIRKLAFPGWGESAITAFLGGAAGAPTGF
jgi:hypothetical protein